MAYLERKGKGWRVCWRDGGRGSAIHKTPTFEAKHQATAALRAIEARQRAERPAIRGIPLPIGDVLTRYLLSREGRTTAAHRTKLETTMRRMIEAHQWKTTSDITPSTTATLGKGHARIIKAVLRFAADHLGQTVDRHAITAARTPAPRHRPMNLITPEEVARVQAAADSWHPADGALVHLISTYGHRGESIVGLIIESFDPKAGTLTMRVKSGDIHRHPLIPESITRLTALAKGRKPEAPLFIGHLGKPWASGSDLSAWLCHSLGCGVLALRRYAITRMLDLGLDARTAASITGHRTPSLLLNTYARTNAARQADAVQKLGLVVGSNDNPAKGAQRHP